MNNESQGIQQEGWKIQESKEEGRWRGKSKEGQGLPFEEEALRKLKERFWRRVEKTHGCWEWKGAKNDQGYGNVKINGRNLGSHRVCWILHNGEIESGLHVLHKCDNSSCVNPEHLWLGTNQENVDDKMIKGRLRPATGEHHGNSSLTMSEVLEIRKLYEGGLTQTAIAKLFPVNQTTISSIITRRTWK